MANIKLPISFLKYDTMLVSYLHRRKTEYFRHMITETNTFPGTLIYETAETWTVSNI